MNALPRWVLCAVTLLFLVVADAVFPQGSPWAAVRVPLLAAAALASLVLAARQPLLLRALVRPPMVFFLGFCAVDLLAAVVSDHPLRCLRYAVGYFIVALIAVSVAETFSERWLLRGLLLTVAAKVLISLALVFQSSAWMDIGRRMQGMLGSPNPMGAAAGLTCLLLLVHGWYDWPTAFSRRRLGRAVLVALGLAASMTLAMTQSVSALLSTLGASAVSALLSPLRCEAWKARLRWLAVAATLLAPVVLFSPVSEVPRYVPLQRTVERSMPPERAMMARMEWWGMLVPVALERPWLGYGPGSTTWLPLPGRPAWAMSAHDLYLEAAIYAGLPAALLMLLFVSTAVLMALRRAWAEADPSRAATAGVLLFYAALAMVEPVVLNGAPSSLLVPLVAAAACAASRGDEQVQVRR